MLDPLHLHWGSGRGRFYCVIACPRRPSLPAELAAVIVGPRAGPAGQCEKPPISAALAPLKEERRIRRSPPGRHIWAQARPGLSISERRGRNAANDRDCALVRPVRMVAGG